MELFSIKIRCTFQLVSTAKKMRTVKVHLKSGYKVMLYQDRD